MLTKKQYELLIFIERNLKEHGVSPSFDEMKEALGLKSKSGIHRLITALEERGFLRRLPHRARALEVVRLPENAKLAASSSGRQREDQPASNIIRANFKDHAVKKSAPAAGVQVPLYGRIAAGTPIQALRDDTHLVDIPACLVGDGEYYALEVDGDSMIDAGIRDGDMIVVERCESADSGTIVVALVDGEEVTLKRLRRRGQSVALEPANAAFETRICGPDQVRVQGRLVGLIRKYD